MPAWQTLCRALALWRQLLLPRAFPGYRRYLYRLLLGSPALLLFLALQGLHWLALLLDEILFPGYRHTPVNRPVFVLGVPRSGTTRTHRLLADDPRFTTFSTWECLFAPAICQRYCILAFAAIDRRIGRPLGRALDWLERRVAGTLEDVHPTSLSAPEEDYLALLPVLCCFILVVPFPDSAWLWRMARCDRDLSPAERQSLMDWYRRCLQRHLYVHGPDRILLSKNAAFAGMAQTLAEAFADSRVVVCERDALQVIGSQFRSLAGARRLCGLPENDAGFQRDLLENLEFYYRNLDALKAGLPSGRCFSLAAPELARDPQGALSRLYLQLDLGHTLHPRQGPTPPVATPAVHRPARQPPLSHWGLSANDLERRFAAWSAPEACL